jgi:hypothetical protein
LTAARRVVARNQRSRVERERDESEASEQQVRTQPEREDISGLQRQPAAPIERTRLAQRPAPRVPIRALCLVERFWLVGHARSPLLDIPRREAGT